ncbi:hypothetical protein RQP46_005875 [Phenoliferia psychrophenolica]
MLSLSSGSPTSQDPTTALILALNNLKTLQRTVIICASPEDAIELSEEWRKLGVVGWEQHEQSKPSRPLLVIYLASSVHGTLAGITSFVEESVQKVLGSTNFLFRKDGESWDMGTGGKIPDAKMTPRMRPPRADGTSAPLLSCLLIVITRKAEPHPLHLSFHLLTRRPKSIVKSLLGTWGGAGDPPSLDFPLSSLFFDNEITDLANQPNPPPKTVIVTPTQLEELMGVAVAALKSDDRLQVTLRSKRQREVEAQGEEGLRDVQKAAQQSAEQAGGRKARGEKRSGKLVDALADQADAEERKKEKNRRKKMRQKQNRQGAGKGDGAPGDGDGAPGLASSLMQA